MQSREIAAALIGLLEDLDFIDYSDYTEKDISMLSDDIENAEKYGLDSLTAFLRYFTLI